MDRTTRHPHQPSFPHHPWYPSRCNSRIRQGQPRRPRRVPRRRPQASLIQRAAAPPLPKGAGRPCSSGNRTRIAPLRWRPPAGLVFLCKLKLALGQTSGSWTAPVTTSRRRRLGHSSDHTNRGSISQGTQALKDPSGQSKSSQFELRARNSTQGPGCDQLYSFVLSQFCAIDVLVSRSLALPIFRPAPATPAHRLPHPVGHCRYFRRFSLSSFLARRWACAGRPLPRLNRSSHQPVAARRSSPACCGEGVVTAGGRDRPTVVPPGPHTVHHVNALRRGVIGSACAYRYRPVLSPPNPRQGRTARRPRLRGLLRPLYPCACARTTRALEYCM